LGCILFREKVGDYLIRVKPSKPLAWITLLNRTKGGYGTILSWKLALLFHWFTEMEVSSKVKDTFPLKHYTFYGESFFVPAEPQAYLEWIYGKDWIVKRDKDWVYYRRKQKLKEVLADEKK
jgi:hypothetical protein